LITKSYIYCKANILRLTRLVSTGVMCGVWTAVGRRWRHACDVTRLCRTPACGLWATVRATDDDWHQWLHHGSASRWRHLSQRSRHALHQRPNGTDAAALSSINISLYWEQNWITFVLAWNNWLNSG